MRLSIFLRSVLFFVVLAGLQRPLFTLDGGTVWAQSRSSQRFNPDISLNGLFAVGYFSEPNHLQFGVHDPSERGFTLQNLELTLTGVVDPFFRAEGHLIFGLDDGESIIEIEEVHMTTMGLPNGLQVMAGQFFTRFGRKNKQHPHAWHFADQTIINALMFGGDGLRNLGVQISVLPPFPFYLELIGSIQNSTGETALSFLSSSEEIFAGRPVLGQAINEGNDLLYMGRLKTSLDLNECQSASNFDPFQRRILTP